MKSRSFRKLASVLAGVMFLTAIPFAKFNTQEVQAEEYFHPCIGVEDLIKNGDFKNNQLAPWVLMTTDPAKAYGEFVDEGYKVTVTDPGYDRLDSRWAVDLRQRCFTIKAGHYYKVKFTVTADHDCMVYPTIGDSWDPYREYWNGEGNGYGYNATTWMPVELKAGETKTVNGSFVVYENVDKCCMQFHMSGDCAPKNLAAGETYSYTFSHISVVG